mgnify:FL=1
MGRENDDGEGEEETNNCEDGFGHVNVTGDTINSDTDSIYDGRPLSNFYQQPVVDRGKNCDDNKGLMSVFYKRRNSYRDTSTFAHVSNVIKRTGNGRT